MIDQLESAYGDGSDHGYGDTRGGGSGDGSLITADLNTGIGPTAWVSGNGYGISTWHGWGFQVGGGYGLGFFWNDRYDGGHGAGYTLPDQRRKVRPGV